ncbi:MAG TPA: methyltransferase domain-containing protein [Bryobacteraceae bacterium]|nr:methyltransferase domain-containing protein [Bryobacteraceae bacterium]
MPHIRPNDPACEAWNKMLIDDFLQKGFYHSIPLPDGRVLEGIIPLDALYDRVREFPIPQNLAGKRVLDIGTWDGFFAFEMERRGAQVTAIDATEVDNFYVAHQLLHSKVEYHVQDVYELTPQRNGYFDIVFFMGVLYHLKHPLLALERVCEVTKEIAVVESFVTNEAPTEEIPALQFYETSELLGQIDNWCGPNVQCLLAFCRTAGFARPALIRVNRQRAMVACYRHWLPEPVYPTAEALNLLACTHAGNYGMNVTPSKDDYLSAFFKSQESGLNLENVFPEVGGYGIHPVAVFSSGGDGWQASFRLPPGLKAGWHDVRLRTANSRFSNPVRVAIDVPAQAESLKITGACDGKTWQPGEITASDDSFVSLWVAGLPVNGDRGNVRVYLGAKRLQLHEVTPDKGDKEPRQVNAKLPKSFPPGRYDLVVTLGETKSEPMPMRVK